MNQCPPTCSGRASNPVPKAGNAEKLRKILELVNENSRLLGSGHYEVLTNKSLRSDELFPEFVHRIFLVILAYYFEDVFDAKSYWCTSAMKLKRVEMTFKVPSSFGSGKYDGAMKAFYLALLPFFSNTPDSEFCYAVIAMPHCAYKETLKAFVHLYEFGVAHRQMCQDLKEEEEKVARAAKEYNGKLDRVKSLKAQVKSCETEEIRMLEAMKLLHEKNEVLPQEQHELRVKLNYELAVGERLASKTEVVKGKIQDLLYEARAEGRSVTPLTPAQEVAYEMETDVILKEQKMNKILKEEIAHAQQKLRKIEETNAASESDLEMLQVVKRTMTNTIDELDKAVPILTCLGPMPSRLNIQYNTRPDDSL